MPGSHPKSGLGLTWERLRDLEATFGETFYLLDLSRFQDNYRHFLASFRSIYPRTNIAYSYKTNYTPRLCQTVDKLGGYAEVVSAMEYDLALRVGVAPERIIVNGPYKRPCDIERALLEGATVNLDSFYEVTEVESLARRHPKRAMRLGVRCSFEVGSGSASRFGFEVESGALRAAMDRLGGLSNCQVVGLHCHFMPPQRSTASYAHITNQMLELARTFFPGQGLAFIDLGGGFFSRMDEELRQQFGHDIPTFTDYAAAIATPFLRSYTRDDGPELILEPGMALTADVMKCAAKVIDLKQTRSRRIALLSTSIYEIKPTLNTKNLPVQVYRASPAVQHRGNTNGLTGPLDLVGYTCMEHDCLYRSYGENLDPGDYVVFDNVGAYTTVLKPPFINPSPPILAYDGATDLFEVVKRREETADVFATYVF